MAVHPPDPIATMIAPTPSGGPSAEMVSSIAPTTGPQVTYIRVIGPNNQPIYVEVKEKTKKRSGFSKEDMEKMAMTAEGVNKYVIKNLCSGAQNITVNWTNLSVSYELPLSGRRKTLKFSDITADVNATDKKKKKYAKLRDEALNVSRTLEIRTTTDPASSSNRPISCYPPLQIDNHWQTWNAYHRLPLNEEIKNNHNDLVSSLQDGLKNLKRNDEIAEYTSEAIPKQAAAHHFTKKFREKLEGELTDLRKNEPPPEKEVALRKYKKKKELLENLISSLDPRLDTKAIYRSVPYANHDLRGLTKEEQIQLSAVSARETEMHLHRKAEEGTISEGNRVTNTINKNQNVPGKAAIISYAQEKGDLLIHDRWIHQSRTEREGRELRGCSMEEFIVFNILNLKSNEDDNFEEALESLALPTGDVELKETIGRIKNIVKDARTETLNEYERNYIVNNPHTYINTLT